MQSVLDLRVIKRQCKKIAEDDLKAEKTDLGHHSDAKQVLEGIWPGFLRVLSSTFPSRLLRKRYIALMCGLPCLSETV